MEKQTELIKTLSYESLNVASAASTLFVFPTFTFPMGWCVNTEGGYKTKAPTEINP